jgi:hypothetical protein
MLEDRARADGEAPSAAANEAADACASGGLSELVQARAIFEIRGTAAEWVDVEVAGPAIDARRACESLVAELAREAQSAPAERAGAEAIADGDAGSAARPLTLRIERACSTRALPPAEIDRPARLIDRRELDAIDLAIVTRSAECPPTTSGRLRAVVLRQGGYASIAACESARERIVADRLAATEHANSLAVAWLEQALAKADERVEKSCPAANAETGDAVDSLGPSPECDAERQIRALLLARRTALTGPVAGADGGTDPLASEPSSAPFCRPGTARAAR